MLPNNLMARGWDCEWYRSSAALSLFNFFFWTLIEHLFSLWKETCWIWVIPKIVLQLLFYAHHMSSVFVTLLGVLYSCREETEELLSLTCPCLGTSCVMVSAGFCCALWCAAIHTQLAGGVGSRSKKKMEKSDYHQETGWFALQGRKRKKKWVSD